MVGLMVKVLVSFSDFENVKALGNLEHWTFCVPQMPDTLVVRCLILKLLNKSPVHLQH